MAERYDVIVIGAGPAGLSAAITLKIRNKKILVLGSEPVSQKVQKAHEISNYLGIPSVKGEDLAERFIEHAKAMEVPVKEELVTAVYAMGDYFGVTTRTNACYDATAVIIATGVNFGKPYEGEENFLGRGVSYCATCDAPLYKGRSAVIIGASPKEEGEARFMAEVAAKVIYIPLYDTPTDLPEQIEIIRDEPVAFTGGFKADRLQLKSQEIKADGFFILRDSISPKQLVPGLELDGNHIRVDRKLNTNIKGCFACGDITGTPYQYIKAAGEGNVAALSAVAYLSQLNK